VNAAAGEPQKVLRSMDTGPAQCVACMFLQNPSFTQSADAGHPAKIEREVPPAKQPVRVLSLEIPNASEFRSEEILSKATQV